MFPAWKLQAHGPSPQRSPHLTPAGRLGHVPSRTPQVWMYCRLYRTFQRFHHSQLLNAAKAGAPFLPISQ